MDKLELDLETLEVDSFQANPNQEEEQGTVHGNAITNYPDNCETYIDRTLCAAYTCGYC